jgi:hypothetical protein
MFVDVVDAFENFLAFYFAASAAPLADFFKA